MNRFVTPSTTNRSRTRKTAALRQSEPVTSTAAAPIRQQRQFYVWDRLLLQLSAGVRNNRHRHFGAFLLIAPDAAIEVNVEPTRRIVGQAILVAPNAWHRLDSSSSRVATLLVGADHEWFGYVTPALRGEAAVPLDLSQLVRPGLDWERLFAGKESCSAVRRFVEFALASMSHHGFRPHTLDPSISAALALLNSARGHMFSPAALGRHVGLSAVTLMRRFKRQLGVRMREYVLWRRLLNTIPLVNEGRTLTEVAQLAGFYDQAHLTRTARRMFDVQPSSVLGLNTARIHRCNCPEHRTVSAR